MWVRFDKKYFWPLDPDNVFLYHLDPVMYGIVESKKQIETKPLFNLVFFQNGSNPDVNSKNTDQQEMLKAIF